MKTERTQNPWFKKVEYAIEPDGGWRQVHLAHIDKESGMDDIESKIRSVKNLLRNTPDDHRHAIIKHNNEIQRLQAKFNTAYNEMAQKVLSDLDAANREY